MLIAINFGALPAADAASLQNSSSLAACENLFLGTPNGPQPYIRQSLGIKESHVVKLFRGIGNSETGAIDGFAKFELAHALFDHPSFWLRSRYFQDAYATAYLDSDSAAQGLAAGEKAVYAKVEKEIRKKGPSVFVENEVATQPLVGQYRERSSTALVFGSTLGSARAESIRQNRILQFGESGVAVNDGIALVIFEVNVASHRVVRNVRDDEGSSRHLVLSHVEGREIDALYLGVKLFTNSDLIYWYE